MEFDLSRYSDFSLAFPTKQTTEDYTFTLMNPGIFSVSLEPNEEVAGELVFKPTEVITTITMLRKLGRWLKVYQYCEYVFPDVERDGFNHFHDAVHLEQQSRLKYCNPSPAQNQQLIRYRYQGEKAFHILSRGPRGFNHIPKNVAPSQ